MPSESERGIVIRIVALLLTLALIQPAQAQTAPTAAPKPSPTKPSPAKPSSNKPAAKKPALPQSDAAAAEHGPCIGVISHVGDSFKEQVVGLTAFGNDLRELPIPSWGLDDLVIARARAAAGSSFAVRRIAYPTNVFEAYDHPHFLQFTDLKSIVRNIVGAGECERYLVVVKSGASYGNTNQVVGGIGVVHQGGILDRFSHTYLFAITGFVVLDGHSFEELKRGAGGIGDDDTIGDRLRRGFSQDTPIRGPSRELEDSTWPLAPDAVMTGLREPTRALLATSLDVAFPRLFTP
jgi:hypothetical protein